ncbi:thioredoxin domain-containing protein [Halocatena marina]|uniref:Thioredoxin domain-containing protein n=1 Tax=Halocatena marina TaxID=2934937 RepID=A0ABD5YGI9_9EURY|nr:thioredoxin domain-containing protein [Halocatena marina]
MTDPTRRNRLDEEQSPYLRQHADNPVNWQPWDQQALDSAKERDVPIFLSIGYSACHWCHVMEEESFQDESIASMLNEQFVPIKIDREERPDLDSIYMTICQLVTGGGGWPLSVWLTPDEKPFYVGTYFPPSPRGRVPGFDSLLENIADSWSSTEDRQEIEKRAEQWTTAIEDELESVPDQPGSVSDSVLDTGVQAAVRSADREYGGFGSGQKFPQMGRLRALGRAYEQTGRSVYREIIEETLDAMVNGGLFDHVGGGFHRYTTDRKWVVPHFEKMLYDNAEITRMLLEGYQLTGRTPYAAAASETLEFVKRELTHDEGGFYATLDAQSEGEEGTFYVWTPEQISEAIEDQTAADLFCDRYGITPTGNFENNRTVLTVSTSIEQLSTEYDLPAETIETKLEHARKQVFEAREKRVRPGRDEKVLTGWNGLMISAFAEGALALDESSFESDSAPHSDSTTDFAETARAALSFVREHLWTDSISDSDSDSDSDGDGGRLWHRYKDGDVTGDGFLSDYAFLGRGALNLYEATGEVEHLNFALDLATSIEREFWDAEERTLYFTPASGETTITRPQELSDQSTPSSTGVAVSLFLALDQFVPHDRFRTIANSVLSTHVSTIESDPLRCVSLVLAADEYASGFLELTIAANEIPTQYRERVASTYLPRRLLTVRPPSEDGLNAWLDALDLDEAPPIWAGREAIDDDPTVYLCEGFTCSPPKRDIDDAFAWREQNA